MIATRALIFAIVAFAAGLAAEAVHIHSLVKHVDMVARHGTCAQPPTLCTGEVAMFGYATTLTYLCSDAAAPTTIHVTVTMTTTITPTVTPTISEAAPVAESPVTPPVEPTATVHSTWTSTITRTITLVRNTKTVAVPTAIPITDKFSVTIPTELLPQSTAHVSLAGSVKQSRFTVRTSTPVLTTAFPSLTLSMTNGTASGILYTHPMASSSMVMLNSSMVTMTGSSIALPTPIFPNTTAHKHYATPTLKMVEVVETSAEANGAVGGFEGKTSLLTGLLSSVVMVVALVA